MSSFQQDRGYSDDLTRRRIVGGRINRLARKYLGGITEAERALGQAGYMAWVDRVCTGDHCETRALNQRVQGPRMVTI